MALGGLLDVFGLSSVFVSILMAPTGCAMTMEIMNESPWLNAGRPPIEGGVAFFATYPLPALQRGSLNNRIPLALIFQLRED